MIIHSATQNANKTQKLVAQALGIPYNRVVCKIQRIGGGFGGKETRCILFSQIAAVAASKLKRPVRLLLERDLDMTITGGRHPFKAIYKAGFTKDGMMKALETKVFNNGGFSADLSIPVLTRCVLFQDSCYKIPNVRVEGKSCKTNISSNTAFRGFGAPQGHIITENWVEHMAHVSFSLFLSFSFFLDFDE
jgi:xanthine dehydrogenase/oxidase